MTFNYIKCVIYGIIADFVLIGCLFGVIHFTTSENRQEMSDLFEAFFRYKFENNHSGAQQGAEGYFLQIEGKDPSLEFMARFAGHSPPVRKGSEFVSEWVTIPQDDGTVLFSGRNNGLLFRIDSCQWVGWGWFTRDHVEICGGYDEASLSASSASYIWKRDRFGWALDSVGPVLVAQNSKSHNKIGIFSISAKLANTEGVNNHTRMCKSC